MEKIGIVTVTYNSEKFLEDFFDSILNQSYDNFNIYIIDNNSQDNTIGLIKKKKDNRVKLICNNINYGVAKANNIGIKAALEDYCSNVLLLNNDIKCEHDLIKKMVETQYNNNCSMVAPKILYHDDNSIIWYAGSNFVKSKGLLPIHFGNRKPDSQLYDGIFQTQYAPTCCLLIKDTVFHDIGYMDEKYFVYFDDTDFLYRVYKHKKHKLFYFSDVLFFHKVGGLTKSFKSINNKNFRGDFFIKQNTRNHVYFLKKVGTFYSYLYISYLFFKNNLKFFIRIDIQKNFSTWKLINKSFFEGLKL